MLHWHLVPQWLARAWPVWALIPVAAIHWLLLAYAPLKPELINKSFGAALQILGGALVVYSINDNLGVFRRQSLRSVAMEWARSIPIKRQPVTLSLGGTAAGSSSATASLTVERKATTIDERVAELERKLVELTEHQRRDMGRLTDQMSKHRAELDQRINETTSRLTELGNRVDHAAVGGFKLQAFGVILAIYGAITSIYA